MVDKYNPARDYTQAIPVAKDNGWRPRRIGDPSRPVVDTGPTPSQLAFRKKDPVTTVVAPKPVVQPQQLVGGYVFTPQGGSFDASGGHSAGGRGSQQQPYGMQVKNSAGEWVRIAPGNYSPITMPGQTPTPINWAQIGDEYGHPGLWATRDRNPNYVAPVQPGVPVTPRTPIPHRPYMEKGGVIPEATNYASGGAVEPAGDHNPSYTTSRSYGRPAGQGASSARYNPIEDKEYWTPAKERKHSAKSGKKSGSAPSGREPAANKVGADLAPAGYSRNNIPSHSRAPVANQVDTAVGVDPSQSGAIPTGAGPAAQVVQPRYPDRAPQVQGYEHVIGTAPVPERPGVPPQAAGPAPQSTGWDQPPGLGDAYVIPPQEFPAQTWDPRALTTRLFGPPHYARGGAVEPAGDHNPNYTSSASYSAPSGDTAPEVDNVKPTPMLMDHVAQALDGGVKFLTQHFGLNASGAMPAPGDNQQAQAGAQRFAQGEGAATQEEIQGIDDHVDPGRRLSEGDRQMTRLAKMTQWYLQQNRPKDAAASAASLMQYGSQRFSRLGAMAGAAYDEYQQTHDPAALKHTTDFLRSAYQMIPDGASLDVKIDPKTHELVGTRTGPDGQDVNFAVTADELPGMIKGVMDKSSYWQEVFKMADPVGYRQQASWAHQAATTADTRAYTEKSKLAGETRTEARALAREGRTAARADARSAASDARAAAGRDERSKRYDMNMQAVGPARQAAEAAYAVINGDNAPDPESPEGKAAQTALDQAASRLYDALPPGRNRDKYMKDAGFLPEEWSYATAAAAAPAGDNLSAALPANAYKGDAPPPTDLFPGAKRAKDGTWWVGDRPVLGQ